MNPLYNILGGNKAVLPPYFNNFTEMMSQFNDFKSKFQGDPKAEVQKLLQSGQLSQQQLNQLQVMAEQFKNLM